MNTASPEIQAPRSTGRFGYFSGVFTPSILTILGVIMYLRFGWVVGNTGLAQAIVVVVVAHLITLATGLSVSSIATNRTVRTGGAYYIISRSLGAPAGAAIGIPLFLGQALSITFYIVGFTESLQMMPLLSSTPKVITGSLVILLLGLVAYKSAELAMKMQYFIMAAIIVSLVSFFMGHTPNPPKDITWWVDDGVGFGAVFAVFFPAVTGIMAGVGMSGDLKNPRRDLPLGTLLAIFTGLAVYIAFPIWLCLNVDMKTLVNDPAVVWRVAAFPSAIYIGVWGATLSSALGSLLTAPRTLQALAIDRLAPRLFARGSGPENEPQNGIVFTFLLAEVGILFGSLDAIANILTMFFLATYGFTNLACGLERWAASPSFRPTFKVPAIVSMAGGLACFYVMSIIDLKAMVGATLIGGGIYAFVQRRDLETTWGDARHGIWSALVRTALNHLRKAEFHPANWRPNLLVMGGDWRKRTHLLDLGATLVQDNGIVTYMDLMEGNVEALADARNKRRTDLEAYLNQRYPHVYSRVDVVPRVYSGAVTVAQAYGVGSFESNTVMLGWPSKAARHPDYARMLRELSMLNQSLLLVHHEKGSFQEGGKRVQIWWGGLEGNGTLMLLIAFLITADTKWRKAKVEVVTVVNSESDKQETLVTMRGMLEAGNLDATPRIMLRKDRSMRELMKAESAGVDLAIVGLRLPNERAVEPFFDRMNELLEVLPSTLLVHSAKNFEGVPVLFDMPVTNPEEDVASDDEEKPSPEGSDSSDLSDSESPQPPKTDDANTKGATIVDESPNHEGKEES